MNTDKTSESEARWSARSADILTPSASSTSEFLLFGFLSVFIRVPSVAYFLY